MPQHSACPGAGAHWANETEIERYNTPTPGNFWEVRGGESQYIEKTQSREGVFYPQFYDKNMLRSRTAQRAKHWHPFFLFIWEHFTPMWNNLNEFIDQPMNHHSCPAVWPCTLRSGRSVTDPTQNPGVDLGASRTGWRWKAQSDLKVVRIDSGIYSELWLLWCPEFDLLSSQERQKLWRTRLPLLHTKCFNTTDI